MCGLCGVYGDISFKEKQALVHLMVFSQLRGSDSTGVAIIPKNTKDDVDIRKSLGGVESFMTAHESIFSMKRKTIDGILSPISILSHHRSKTVGEVSIDNAHPFLSDKLVGMHNGTIPKEVFSSLKTYKQGLTDSEICLRYIDSFDNPEDAFEDIRGQYAFVWHDLTDDTLYLARNDKRDLFVVKTKDEKTIFYASEAWMLHVALGRTGVEYNKESGVRSVLPDKVHRWGVKDGKVVLFSSVPTKPFKFKYTPPVKPAAYFNKWNLSKLLPGYRSVAGSEVEFIEDYAHTVHGQMVHKSRWARLVENGCVFCGDKLKWEDRKSVQWVDSESPACETCATTSKNDRKVN